MDISLIDKNLKVQTAVGDTPITFHDAEESPFKLYGLFREGDRLVRMPGDIAATVNKKVAVLYQHTAGGRVKFRTDSVNVAIRAEMNNISVFSHQPLIGTAGFDLYEKDSEHGEVYLRTYKPPTNIKDGFESLEKLEGKKMRELTLHFPTYSGVNKLYIGLDPDAKIEAAEGYTHEKPVVFYGSSITQGACASKPADTYESVLSRRFDFDYINLGFSGSACAEEAIYNYINTLDMSIFVYDYDHNAKDPDHLLRTHERMFLAIREKHPTLPIIMMTRPRYIANSDTKARLEIIKATYERARANGDENVYLVTGRELMALCKTNGMADTAHPTSLGFFSMAEALSPIFEKILNKN